MNAFRTLLLFLSFVSFVLAQPSADLILSVPNLAGTLTTQYSGYLVVNETHGRALHYWFVYSQNDPANDPVVLWLNGGPGCSSLDGFLYEHGPWMWGDNLTLVDNPYSWTKVANVIYLEAPAGVGFSYSNTSSDYHTDDQKTAADNYAALKIFYSLFPSFTSNKFFISGESYAGVYVPTLAQLVAEGVASGDFPAPFKGILVGNGVTDEKFDGFWKATLPFLAGHALLGQTSINRINNICTKNMSNPLCQNALERVESVFNDIDVYNIIGDCYHQRPYERNAPGLVPPCTDAFYATEWLNQDSVKEAIHVRTDITWAICTTSIRYRRLSAGSMIPIYKYLLENGYQVLVYSGDVDGAVPYTGTEAWIRSLNLKATKYWAPWYNHDSDGVQVGGFKTEYPGGLTFLTVRGAGHMVPQFKPSAAFKFFDAFINGRLGEL